MHAKELEDSLSGYEEQPAQAFHCGAGDARCSEFTADGGLLTGKLHGYRVTMLGSQRAFSTVCRCRESDWATLKPVFINVINCITPGNG